MRGARHTSPMHVVVAGSHGFIGSALCRSLRAGGHRVSTLVRGGAHGPDEIPWDPPAGRLDPRALAGADAVVDLAGVSVSSRPLTAKRKREVVSSRVDTAGLVARTLAAHPQTPRVFLQASGIGAYGPRGDTVVDEGEPLGTTFFADVVRQWEAAAAPAQDAGVRVVFLRTGVVLGRGGGALAPLWPLLLLGLGGRIGSGDQYWSWITLHDEVRAIEHLLGADVEGPVNLVARADRNRDVVRALAHALSRPAWTAAPEWAVRLALRDFADEIVGSLRATPAALTSSGFRPDHPDLATAAAWLVAHGA